MSARLVLVECNASYGMQLALRAAATGLDVLVLAVDPARYAELRCHGIAIEACATDRLDSVLRTIGTRPVAGVLAGYELALPVACATAQALGLPGPSPTAAQDTLVKPRARALSNQMVGNPVPFWLVESDTDVAAIGPARYPVVAKPAASGGSLGVAVLATPAQLRDHVARWLHAPDERGRPLDGPLLVEQFVPGTELSVELFHGRPVALVRKQLGGASGVVEIGHIAVPWTSAPERSMVEPYLTTLVERLDLGWGPVHVEIRLEDGRPHLVEINLRLAGDRIPELVNHATGVDLYDVTLATATGGPAAVHPAVHRAAAIRFLTAPAEGTVTAVWGEEDAAGAPEVVQVGLTTRVGAQVRPAEDSGDRLGYVVTAADDAPTAAAAA
ncbi:MAG TPA: ATP-grasp domain-containing protein, partial [Pseudonocardiaceae bacterium]|nr:ATP-grasp domain-containing protein [Pseudonocardiaceae bacterium]